MDLVKQKYATVPVESLTPHPDNPRRSDEARIGESIDANGFYGAVLIQESTGVILAGEHRWRQAVEKGAEKLPVIKLDVDDATARRIVVADNRTSDLAVYDEKALLDLLTLVAADDGDLAGTGFTEDDIDDLWRRQPKDATPPGEFPSYDDDTIETEHKCPRCGYEFSGGS